MSQLIKKLRQVSESIAPSLGFKTSSTSCTQPILLIAAIPENNTSGITGIIEAGIDAIAIHIKNFNDFPPLPSGVSDNIPWGAFTDIVTTGDIFNLPDVDCDFITFSSSKAPATTLDKEIGKIIHLTTPVDDSFLWAINQMPIDAVLADFRGEEGIITVSNIIDCYRLGNILRKPLLAAISRAIDDKELLTLWEAGVNGVILDIKDISVSDINKLQKAIASFPQTRKKPVEHKALLPRQ